MLNLSPLIIYSVFSFNVIKIIAADVKNHSEPAKFAKLGTPKISRLVRHSFGERGAAQQEDNQDQLGIRDRRGQGGFDDDDESFVLGPPQKSSSLQFGLSPQSSDREYSGNSWNRNADLGRQLDFPLSDSNTPWESSRSYQQEQRGQPSRLQEISPPGLTTITSPRQSMSWNTPNEGRRSKPEQNDERAYQPRGWSQKSEFQNEGSSYAPYRGRIMYGPPQNENRDVDRQQMDSMQPRWNSQPQQWRSTDGLGKPSQYDDPAMELRKPGPQPWRPRPDPGFPGERPPNGLAKFGKFGGAPDRSLNMWGRDNFGSSGTSYNADEYRKYEEIDSRRMVDDDDDL